MAPHEAPTAVTVDEDAGDAPAKPVATSYCCGRCRSETCCCGPCARPCTPRTKACAIAATVMLVAGAVVAIVCGVYFGVFFGRVKLSVNALSGARALGSVPSGRRLLQSGGLAPSSAMQSSTASAYAQARGHASSEKAPAGCGRFDRLQCAAPGVDGPRICAPWAASACFGARGAACARKAASRGAGGGVGTLSRPHVVSAFAFCARTANGRAPQVDALELNVAYVRFAPVSGGGHDLASTSWGASQAFTLRSGVNTVPLTATVEKMVPGDYFAADFVYWNRWSIQAFCRTANAFLYTTATGVTSLPSTPSAMPSDYAPFAYDMMPTVGAFFEVWVRVFVGVATAVHAQRGGGAQ